MLRIRRKCAKWQRRPRLALLAALLVPHHPVQAKETATVSLSPVWRLESDDDYSFEADYRAPPPVKGLALHGYLAGEEFDVDSAGQIAMPANEKCREPAVLADPRGLPEAFPPRTDTEFWLYRSGDQGLYLSRNWVFERSAQCEPVARIVTKVVHLSVFNGIARFVEIENGGDPLVSSVAVAGDANYPIPNRFVVIDDRAVNQARPHYSRRKPVDRVENTRLRRQCFDNSFAFTFSTTCYLIEPGRWHGLEISADTEADDGSNYSEYGLREVSPRALIDGRLFEWGREIALAQVR